MKYARTVVVAALAGCGSAARPHARPVPTVTVSERLQ